MANIRVKDLDTKASFASDDEILMDSPSGTGTMLRDAFIAAVASQIVAAPSTYKIATLDGANKLTSSQDPSQSVSYLGGHDMVANSPALADGSGTAGDTYYVTNPGTRNYGSGNITAQEGDALVYSGSVWQLVEGIANILDGISTASTARTTLEVNSIDEDAEANALKTTAPALYFNGSSSVVTVADDDKLSFTDGVNDLPFTVSAWIKCDDLSVEVPIITKFGAGREFNFYVQDSDLALYLWDGTNSVHTRTTSAITGYNGQWIHVAATYAGAGPNSDNAFTAAADGITLYINGGAQTITAANNASYTGIANTSEALRLGARSGIFGNLHLRDAKIFNRELTAAEVAEAMQGDLGFSGEWAGALGGVYTSDFSAGVNGFTGDVRLTSDGNIDDATSGNGEDDALRLTCTDTANNTHYTTKSGAFTAGKRVRLSARVYIPSSNSNVDGIRFGDTITNNLFVSSTPTQDTWVTVSGEGVTGGQTALIILQSAGSVTFQDAGGDDVVYIKDIKITSIGTLADFRSEDYNESASKLLDRSSNNFVGVGTSVTLTGNQRHISADTIDLKNLPTSSAGLSAGEVWSNSGVLTVV